MGQSSRKSGVGAAASGAVSVELRGGLRLWWSPRWGKCSPGLLRILTREAGR